MTLFHRPACVRHTLTYRWPCTLPEECVRVDCVVMLSVVKLMDQFLSFAPKEIKMYLKMWRMPLCMCVLFGHVSVQHHQFSNQQGNPSLSEEVEVQFVDCKINVGALLTSHSAWWFPKIAPCLLRKWFDFSINLCITSASLHTIKLSTFEWLVKTGLHVQTCSPKW